jgi:hypothetical protein
MARIAIAGYMIRHPLAGNLFAYFHYVLGLHRLGHEVCYLEESGWPRSCYDPGRGDYGDDPAAGLRAVRALFAEHGIEAPACYVDRESGAVAGAAWEDVKRMLAASDLLVNVGGVSWLPEFRLARRRALIDMDPLFTQVGRFARESLGEYHAHFSYGANIGRPGCSVPTCGIDWLPALPPVVPEAWRPAAGTVPAGATQNEAPAAASPASAPFTTIANWSAYGSVTHAGERYGQKDEEFLRFLALPGRATRRLELALAAPGRGIGDRLRAAGWLVRDAGEVSASVPAYRAYIAGSRGEFSVAKHAYVKTRCGWFSDRSVTYLAAGRPVVIQDTGFTDWLAPGPGILPFSTLDQAVECLERVDADYERHACGALAAVEATFGYRCVLPPLIAAALGEAKAMRCGPLPGRSRS